MSNKTIQSEPKEKDTVKRKPPSTRYQGSKEKLAGWIWKNVSDLEFDTFLDGLGGTGGVGYTGKAKGKRVFYNDVFRSNYYVGLAVIENESNTLSEGDVDFLLNRHQEVEYSNFVQKTFKDIYYTDEENSWLDMFIGNLKTFDNIYKKALALSALFQACLVKRPYNLFHRANLYMRTADVDRSFGNKTTWETPFPVHFRKFADEYNSAVFKNDRENRAMNYDVFNIPNIESYDLVYIDTPYYSEKRGASDYYLYYHFLEGLCIYLEEGPKAWDNMIDYSRKPNPLKHNTDLEKSTKKWTKQGKIKKNFDKLFEKFQNSILAVSYNSEGIPSKEEMKSLLERYKDDVEVKTADYQYALSSDQQEELLFLGY